MPAPAGCVAIDWQALVTALTAAVVAVAGTLAAKHRPADRRTRAGDGAPAAPPLRDPGEWTAETKWTHRKGDTDH